MSKPVSPLSREHWLKSQELFARVLKGEPVRPDEVLDGKPQYGCRACQDTAFVIETDLHGVSRSRRCPACKPRVDAETRAQSARRGFDADEIPDSPAPRPRDFKQAAGLDGEED